MLKPTMLTGAIFTNAGLTTPRGMNAHLNNIYQALSLFSRVETYHPPVDTRVIGTLTYSLGILLTFPRSYDRRLDYIWVRSSLINWLLLKKARRDGVASVYDLVSPVGIEARLGGNNLIFRIAEADESRSVRYAAVIRVVNAKCRDYFAAKYRETVPGLEAKMHVIPIPVDIRKYRRKTNFDFKNPSIVFAGRYHRWQGLEEMIESLSQADMPGATLNLYMGNVPPHIAAMIRDGKSRIRVQQSFLPHDEFISVLPENDIFVIPRPSNPANELNAPIKLVEAMCCGLPIVATSVGGVTEYLKHKETGYLVKPDEPRALAEGIAEVMGNPRLAREMGENARQFAEQTFDSRIVSRQIKEMLDATMTQKMGALA